MSANFRSTTLRRRTRKTASLRSYSRALARDALPAAGALDEHVHEPVRHRDDLAGLGSGHMAAEPDDRRLAVDAHAEAVEHRRIDALIEVERLRHLRGLVAARSVAVGGHELVGQHALDEAQVLGDERGVPGALELNQLL